MNLFLDKSRKYVNRFAYDASATYQTYDFVWFEVGGVTYRYNYLGDADITGVAPDTANSGWVRHSGLTETPTQGLQGIRGLTGPEPSDARLNALIANQVLEPSDARLNALITTVVGTLGLQDAAEVNTLIQTYLDDNDFTDETDVQHLINEAYLNVLSDLGVLQVERSLDGRDYFPTLNTYNFVRIRLNNPDADWHIIEVGQAGSGTIIGGRSNRYYVPDGDVSQVTNEITLTIPTVSTYTAGMKVEFETEGFATAENVTLRINALDFKRLLKFDGTEFEHFELRQGIKIEAMYDGVDFVTDFREEPHFHYVLADNVAVTTDGNDYTITDSHIVGFGVSPPSIIGFKTKRTNTGGMTLIVNGSTPQPIRLSDASEVSAGLVNANQFVLLDLRAGVGWIIVNISPPLTLKRDLIASLTLLGAYPNRSVSLINFTLENGNINVWDDYYYNFNYYVGAFDTDPTIENSYREGYLYYNSATDTWRRLRNVTVELADNAPLTAAISLATFTGGGQLTFTITGADTTGGTIAISGVEIFNGFGRFETLTFTSASETVMTNERIYWASAGLTATPSGFTQGTVDVSIETNVLVWEDVPTSDISVVLDDQPSLVEDNQYDDGRTVVWLGQVGSEQAANTLATTPDSQTTLYVAYFDNAVKMLTGRANSNGYSIVDGGKGIARSTLIFPDANNNPRFVGAIIEISHMGSVLTSIPNLFGNFGFEYIDIDLEFSDGITFRGSQGSRSLSFTAFGNSSNTVVANTENLQIRIYEWIS